MKSEKKVLLKNFNAVVKDLLDNYDQYTDEEKAKVKELFEKASELNAILDKYDIERTIDLSEYLAACSLCFEAMR